MACLGREKHDLCLKMFEIKNILLMRLRNLVELRWPSSGDPFFSAIFFHFFGQFFSSFIGGHSKQASK